MHFINKQFGPLTIITMYVIISNVIVKSIQSNHLLIFPNNQYPV